MHWVLIYRNDFEKNLNSPLGIGDFLNLFSKQSLTMQKQEIHDLDDLSWCVFDKSRLKYFNEEALALVCSDVIGPRSA